jgi:hypothetical protein
MRRPGLLFIAFQREAGRYFFLVVSFGEVSGFPLFTAFFFGFLVSFFVFKPLAMIPSWRSPVDS